jgi:hypothetical protein
MHLQTKLESFIEQSFNVISGLVISIFIVQPLVFGMYGIKFSLYENLTIATIFTIVSIIRGYFWRRFYNRKLIKRLLKESSESK